MPVNLLNDTYQASDVVVEMITADADGNVLTRSEALHVNLAALDDKVVNIELAMPKQSPFVIYAYLSGEGIDSTVISRRKVGFEHPGIDTKLPAFNPSILMSVGNK